MPKYFESMLTRRTGANIADLQEYCDVHRKECTCKMFVSIQLQTSPPKLNTRALRIMTITPPRLRMHGSSRSLSRGRGPGLRARGAGEHLPRPGRRGEGGRPGGRRNLRRARSAEDAGNLQRPATRPRRPGSARGYDGAHCEFITQIQVKTN